MEFETKKIRNISIAGHGQTGKTTLLEHMLFAGSVIQKPETVESGKTVSDNSPEEIQRRISVYASLAHIKWNDRLINIWDTPGSSDFTGEVTSAFRSCDMALLTVDSRTGAQIETIKLWRDLDRRNKARAVFINRCDDPRANFTAANKDIHEKFSVEVCPVTIPMISNNKFSGVIDVLHNKAYPLPQPGQKEEAQPVPDGYADARADALAVLAGSAAEGDDDLLVKFIDEGELTPEEITYGLKIALANNRIVPSFAGSAALGSGIKPLLDFIAEIAPAPEDDFETALTADGETTTIRISTEAKMSALCVKTASDQFSGRLSYLKIITGVLKADSEYVNVNEGRKEKIGKLYRCTGKKLEEIKEACAGDICIAAKLASTKTSDTLAEETGAMPFIRLHHPEPIYSMAVSAAEKKDEDKMGELLAKAAEEDRTLSYRYDPETKQNVFSGMGELHIGIILERVQAQAKIQIQTSVPRVAYRETVQRKAQADALPEFGEQHARNAHHAREQTGTEQVADRFGNAQPLLRKGGRPLADRLLTAARADHQHDKKPEQPRTQKRSGLFRRLPLLHQRIDGHKQKKDCVRKRNGRPNKGEDDPVPDARTHKKERRQRDDGDLPPAIKRMQQAHDRLFFLIRARLDDGADEHLDQPAARRVDGGSDKQPDRGRRQHIRQNGKQNKPRAAEDVRRDRAGAVADPVHEFCREQVDGELDPEIDGDHGADQRKGYAVCMVECDEEQRRKVVDDRLRGRTGKTRRHRVACFQFQHKINAKTHDVYAFLKPSVFFYHLQIFERLVAEALVQRAGTHVFRLHFQADARKAVLAGIFFDKGKIFSAQAAAAAFFEDIQFFQPQHFAARLARKTFGGDAEPHGTALVFHHVHAGILVGTQSLVEQRFVISARHRVQHRRRVIKLFGKADKLLPVVFVCFADHRNSPCLRRIQPRQLFCCGT